MRADPNSIRAFIAIDLPNEVKKVIYNSLNKVIIKLKPYVKWVEEENLHLTLRFLGQITPEIRDSIKLKLIDLVKLYSPILLSIGEVGTFPTWKDPRVLWIGIHVLKGNLISLQKEIETIAQFSGLPAEHQRFHPHITIGRVKSAYEFVGKLWRNTKLPEIDTIKVNEVVLFKSTLSPTGAIYDALERFQLSMKVEEEIQ